MKRKKVRSKRLFFAGILFSVAFMGLVSRMVYLMVINGSNYKQLALNNWTKTIKEAPKRGEILSRNGSKLALSEDVYRVDVDLNVFEKYLKDKKIPEEQAVEQLSQKLNVKKSEVEKILDSKDGNGKLLKFVSLKRKVDKKGADAIKNLKYNGIIISNDVERMYPNDSVLSQVIGHTNLDENGTSGVG